MTESSSESPSPARSDTVARRRTALDEVGGGAFSFLLPRDLSVSSSRGCSPSPALPSLSSVELWVSGGHRRIPAGEGGEGGRAAGLQRILGEHPIKLAGSTFAVKIHKKIRTSRLQAKICLFYLSSLQCKQCICGVCRNFSGRTLPLLGLQYGREERDEGIIGISALHLIVTHTNSLFLIRRRYPASLDALLSLSPHWQLPPIRWLGRSRHRRIP